MALPMMKATEFGADPHTAEPTSKRRVLLRKVVLTSKTEYIFPNKSCDEHVVRRYAEPYQPMSVTEWKSFVICGMAVVIIIRSCGG